MSIQPIDLQTLYAQLDKIGKAQVDQQQALHAQQEKQQQANKIDAENRMKSVQDVEASSEEGIAVNAESSSREQYQADEEKKKKDEAKNNATDSPSYITDPSLGSKIDISG